MRTHVCVMNKLGGCPYTHFQTPAHTEKRTRVVKTVLGVTLLLGRSSGLEGCPKQAGKSPFYHIGPVKETLLGSLPLASGEFDFLPGLSYPHVSAPPWNKFFVFTIPNSCFSVSASTQTSPDII